MHVKERRTNLKAEIEFTVSAVHGGEKLYALRINGKLIEDDLTIDEVIRRINRDDEECLGEKHCPHMEEPKKSRR